MFIQNQNPYMHWIFLKIDFFFLLVQRVNMLESYMLASIFFDVLMTD